MSIGHETGAGIVPEEPLQPVDSNSNYPSEKNVPIDKIAHSGLMPEEAGGERPVDVLSKPLKDAHEEGLLGSQHDTHTRRNILIGGAATVVAIASVVGAIVATKGNHKATPKSVSKPATAGATPTAGVRSASPSATASTIESSASAPVSPSAVPSPSELNYYLGEGNINITRMLPGDKIYTVQDDGNYITLPEVRPVSVSSTGEQLADSANSVMAQISYYLKTNNEAVAQQVLSHLVVDPSLEMNLPAQRKMLQQFRTAHPGFPVEVSTFEDSASAPATFNLDGTDASGNPLVSLVSGDLELVHFGAFKVTDQNGNIQNKQQVSKFQFAVTPDGRISSYELNFANS